MPFIRVRDIDIYYELHGQGERLLHISGTNGDLRLIPRLGRGPLEKDFQVLYYDQRGLGQTSKPETDYTMADYADDAAALLDAMGWDRAHVMGVSFGGMVAQNLVLRHPAKVDRLVLACTSPGGAGGSSYDLLALEGVPEPQRTDTWLSVMDVRNDPTTDPPTLAPYMDVILEGRRQRPVPSAEAAAGALRQLRARAGHDVWDDLGTVTAPTLVIGGTYDMQAPPENLERTAERIAMARLVFCEGGHLFLLQDRSAYRTIIDFLNG